MISYEVIKRYIYEYSDELASSSFEKYTLEEAIALAKELQQKEKNPDAYYEIHVIGWED